MMDSRFKIVFAGRIREGFDNVTVRQRLASLYKSTPKQIDRLFSGQRLVLKSALSREEAERFRRVFDETGAVCEVVPENLEAKAEAVPPSRPDSRPPAPTLNTPETAKNPVQSPYVGTKTPRRRRTHPLIWALATVAILGILYAIMLNLPISRMPKVTSTTSTNLVAGYSGNWVEYEDPFGYYSLELPPGFSSTPALVGDHSRVTFRYGNAVSLTIDAAPRTQAWDGDQELQKHILRIRQGREAPYSGAVISRTSSIQLAAAEGYLLFLEKDAMQARIVVLVNADNTRFRSDIVIKDKGDESMLESLTQAVLERMDMRPRPETP